MRIYLNTRGFYNDYQWFNVEEDNTLTVAKNYWEIPELANLPITDDFSIVIGKIGDRELYLLITDVDSGRIDNRERIIKNSFLFVSEDEVILRKITMLALFDYDEFWSNINSTIVEFPESEFGFSVEYSHMIEVINSFLPRYDVKFEFDADTGEKRFSRFAELYLKYTTQSDNGEEVVSYRLNPIFEFKLKRFLLSEIFPEDFNVIFAYFPKLSLEDIEKAEIYLAVGKTLDKFAKNIFLRDLEDWAKVEIKEPKFKGLKEELAKYRSELFVSALAILVFIPLIGSYINLYYEKSELEKENHKLKSISNIDISEIRDKMQNQIEELKNRSRTLSEKYQKIEDELKNRENELKILQKELEKERAKAKVEEVDSNTIQNLRTQITTLNSQLKNCETEKHRIYLQKDRLSAGYQWYKDLYNNCKSQRIKE